MNLKVGAVGLGRLGYQHAFNLRFAIGGVTLSALCDVDAEKLEATARAWAVPNTYTSFEQMIDNASLDAVVISSPSALHASQIAYALKKGLHVFSEKPLGTTIQECQIAQKAVAQFPQQVFMLGFMRRYDPSYADAKKRVASGEIGQPILFRAYSQDPEKTIQGTLAYAGHSGGLFIDMAVHDIDLMRWFMGSEPKTLFAAGGCYAHPEFAKFQDGDNAAVFMTLQNGALAFLLAGRTAPHGYNVETEIIGTKGTLRIASVPQKNLVEILDEHGVRKECSQDFLERFDEAYRNELQAFVRCIAEGTKPEVTVYDGIRCTDIAEMCKSSFQTGQLISCL